jgi:hypothetical protein
MADHFYGVDVGHGLEPGGVAGAAGVTVGTSTASTHVELRVTDAVAGLTGNKGVLLRALDAIRAKIVESDAPA